MRRLNPQFIGHELSMNSYPVEGEVMWFSMIGGFANLSIDKPRNAPNTAGNTQLRMPFRVGVESFAEEEGACTGRVLRFDGAPMTDLIS
jgi:hypothetical protein